MGKILKGIFNSQPSNLPKGHFIDSNGTKWKPCCKKGGEYSEQTDSKGRIKRVWVSCNVCNGTGVVEA